MLLRAAAIDEAALDLLALAAASSRRRNSIDQPMPPGIGAGTRRAARTAAKRLALSRAACWRSPSQCCGPQPAVRDAVEDAVRGVCCWRSPAPFRQPHEQASSASLLP